MKKIALLSAGAVIAGSLVTVAAPADASVTTADTCSALGIATQPMAVTSSSDAASQMLVGETKNITLTSAIDVPASAASLLYGTVTGLTGTGTAMGSIEGPLGVAPTPIKTAPTDVVTGVLASGDLNQVVSSGPVAFTPTSPGDYRVVAGQVQSSLSKLVAGLPMSSPTLTCEPPAGTPPVVDAIRVLSPSTTDLAVSPTTVAYGQASRATAKVTSGLPSLPAGLGAASGTVTFSVGDKTVNGTLTSGQTSVSLPRLGAGHTYPVTAVYEPDSNAFYDESQDSAALMVVKDGTLTVVTAPTIKRRHVEVATVKVRSTHGATVRGTVRAVLKKGTKTLRAKTVTLRRGTAKVRFGKLRKKGRYTVVATYRGSHNFKRSVDKDAFRVR